MKLKKINFEELFLKLQNKNYTIIKLDPKFPDYIEGQDLDILCYDINDISNVIVSFLFNSGLDTSYALGKFIGTIIVLSNFLSSLMFSYSFPDPLITKFYQIMLMIILKFLF